MAPEEVKVIVLKSGVVVRLKLATGFQVKVAVTVTRLSVLKFAGVTD